MRVDGEWVESLQCDLGVGVRGVWVECGNLAVGGDEMDVHVLFTC